MSAPDPGPREAPGRPDFVEAGLPMPPAAFDRARSTARRFLEDAPAYPGSAYGARGIVLVGGGIRYAVPAYVAVSALRRRGCLLPVELWGFAHESPPAGMEAALRALGVTFRPVDHVMGSSTPLLLASGWNKPYALKSAALLLSRFEEVLFLDADNVALRDPSFLFDSDPFLRTGAVVWPDFWNATVAPDFYRLFGLDPSKGPRGSHESGQMLFDKARAWRPLLLALLFNIQGRLYYKLLSDYMGQGDKETFALALHALGAPYHVTESPVGRWGGIRIASARA